MLSLIYKPKADYESFNIDHKSCKDQGRCNRYKNQDVFALLVPSPYNYCLRQHRSSLNFNLIYIRSNDGLKAFRNNRPGVFIKRQLNFNLHRSSLQILFRRSIIASCMCTRCLSQKPSMLFICQYI